MNEYDVNDTRRRFVERTGQQGFTLIEILLVVAIIGILAAIAVPNLTGRTEEARIGKAKADIASMSSVIVTYELDVGKYPSSLQDLVNDPGKKQWKGPYYLNGKLPKDPWDNPYTYNVTGRGFTIKSMGPDGVDGNDDISNVDE